MDGPPPHDTPRRPGLAAVVLAAGFGRRVGGPKALLLLPGARTFLETVLASVRAAQADDLIAVLGPWWTGVPSLPPDVRTVVNPDPDRGQVSSVRCAISAIGEPGGVALLVAPVDHPLVLPVTFAAVAAAHRAAPGAIVVATHAGRRGHPVVFPAALVPDLLGPAATEGGARALLRAHPDRVVEVACDDAWVTRDVDTAEDYRRTTADAGATADGAAAEGPTGESRRTETPSRAPGARR
ncbi:MAG: nucleotidyltransferase family protein [Deltaproteobacteria bacterium]|nr:nucleotidyltransferase family protein [Deltaproteobacteria bacterium]